MIYHASQAIMSLIHGFNVIHYVSFRALASFLTALILMVVLGSWFIKRWSGFLRAKSREYTPETHRAKDDTPTMGGVLIVFCTLFTLLLWGNWGTPLLWIFVICLLLFMVIGAVDDWFKIRYKKGISERTKFRAQIFAALVVTLLWLATKPETVFCVPFLKDFQPNLGLLIIPWAIFMLVGVSNAVNITDGLDGLAATALSINFVTFSLIAYAAGHFMIAAYLQIPFAATSEIAVVGAALCGAVLGFLWFNAYPAQIFMGDAGSLSLGAALALIALYTRQELLLVITGGIFVVETVSVMLQVFSYKMWRQRIFKMAPLHHHFELLGWPESKITVRFGIVSIVLCLLALLSLKIR